MNIKIGNFGPISSGEINLKPLTILIGPNYSGKSYLAMLVNSIFKLQLNSNDLARNLGREYNINVSDSKGNSSMRLAELKSQIGNLKSNETIKLSDPIIEDFYDMIFDYIYNVNLKEKLNYSFGSSLDELTQIGKDGFEIELNSNSVHVSITRRKNNLRVINKRKMNVSFQIRYDESSITAARFFHKVDEDGKKLYTLIYNEGAIKTEGETTSKASRFNFLFYAIIFILVLELENNYPSISCHYLPAARSNLVQGYKPLLSNMAKDHQLSVINPSKKNEIPFFSGVVIDFISAINDFKIEKGHFDALIKQIERGLIHGEIITEDLEKSANRQIYYKYLGQNIPLHRASSAISELAPIILYIKYILKIGDILIIEEPEAHLHPENQRILAKFLVRLIRKGVILIITTHSDYLLKQINAFILLSKISPEKRFKKYKYAKNDYITPEEVATYSFISDKKNGYKIENVEINWDEGISQKEFIKIYKLLYDESVKLQRDLNEIKENGAMHGD